MTTFYLGRPYDLSKGKASSAALHYDPADLTTHAVVTGMTGSGKTGLCVTLMEEAALLGIPALIIDPKGDLTNLLLHFPALAPADFQPWLDAELIRRTGKPLEQAAAETAATWKQGLADWDITPDRIQKIKDTVDFAIYTPGSDAGKSVSVMASLEAPPIPWEGNREILREKISATVVALLGLVGYEEIDPVRSREHILLSNIFEQAWSKGKSLDLTELILQTQKPPFEKLGAFPVETFFPEKDRMGLAMMLNNILASPTFETWREGQPLDVPSLLYTPEGKPRHSIFYVAHLSDAERMFFITLILSALETWMRTQAGSSTLRALLYFDEIYGYLPPQRNPPSKQPLLRMLKQARAFGVGLLLATQNPVDIDYKALANAGTWFVGKLQTERDKERLLDGLESITGGLDRGEYTKLIAALGRRIFLLHNVHDGHPKTFQTRWTMNFLAGPLTRAQIPALNGLARSASSADSTPKGESLPATNPSFGFGPESSIPGLAAGSMSTLQPVSLKKPTPERPSPTTTTRPSVPAGIEEYFLPLTYSLTGAFSAAAESVPQDASLDAVLYRPVMLAQAQARILDRKYGVDKSISVAAMVDDCNQRTAPRWDDFAFDGVAHDKLEKVPAPQARYESLPATLTDVKRFSSLKTDFADWVYRSVKVTVRVNAGLKVWMGPDASTADFRKACSDAARAGRDAEYAKVVASIDRQLASLARRLEKEQLELKADQEALTKRSWEEMQTVADNVLGIFRKGKVRRLTRAVEKNRLRGQTEADVEESKVSVAQLQEQIDALTQDRARREQEINARWADVADDMTEVPLTPKKSDIFIEHFGVAWMPFYLVKAGEGVVELPAFGG